jgi:hypothetical protein
VRADRAIIGFAHVEKDQLKQHPDWHCYRDSFLNRDDPGDFLAYKKVARFRSTKDKGQFWVYYDRQVPNLAKFRIAFFPDDELGLRYAGMVSILDSARDPQLARLEIAVDFGSGSGVDGPYVRRHFLSGKCTPDSVNHWGRRNGTKYIRSYYKREISAHRVEIQLNWRFLRTNHIDNISDLPKLAELLPRRHIWFVRLNELRVIEHLRKTRSAKRTLKILKEVNALEKDLYGQLQILRMTGGLKNTRRLLEGLEINRGVENELKKWASQWPTSTVRPTPNRGG